MKLVLIGNYLSSATERVRIALALKGLDYDYISLSDLGWNAYREINPQGLMPTLKLGTEIIPQSTAILAYLEESYPARPLLPDDAILRAQARGFAQHITSEMHAIDVIRVRRFLKDVLSVDECGVNRWQTHWFKEGFTALEEQLSRRSSPYEFCFGDEPGWADLHLIPQVRKGVSRFDLDLSPYPIIAAIYEKCIVLPAFQKAAPQSQPDYPETVNPAPKN